MPRSLSYAAPRKRLYPFQCPKTTACPLSAPPPGLSLPQEEQPGLLEGSGVGRKRVNEPLHSLASSVRQNIPRSDDGRIPRVTDYGTVRTVPIVVEPKEIEQSGEGISDLLPGDALKMKLIKKIACQAKKEKLKKAHQITSSKKFKLGPVIDKTFPILLKQVDPKAIVNTDKARKALAGLKKIVNSKIKNPKADVQTADKIAAVFIDVFKKMGQHIPDNAEKVLSNELMSALSRFETGTLEGSGRKSKQFWKSFGKSFKKTLKVGLPIIGVAGTLLGQPEVALAAGLVEGLL